LKVQDILEPISKLLAILISVISTGMSETTLKGFVTVLTESTFSHHSNQVAITSTV
jgi:hypothetical protein